MIIDANNKCKNYYKPQNQATNNNILFSHITVMHIIISKSIIWHLLCFFSCFYIPFDLLLFLHEKKKKKKKKIEYYCHEMHNKFLRSKRKKYICFLLTFLQIVYIFIQNIYTAHLQTILLQKKYGIELLLYIELFLLK
jgi:hypothetical protein